MIITFFIQLFFAVIFFLGLTGLGFYAIKYLKIRGNSVLLVGLSFFFSLTVFTILATLALYVFSNKIITLALLSVLYFFVSYLILFFYLRKSTDFKQRSLNFFRKNKTLIAGLFFTLTIFFLGLYKTSLLDEQLHRPVVKSFVENGIFPLKDPMNPNSNFTLSYHYGMDVVGSAIKIITHQGVSESLDILKLSYMIAAFFLFYGIIFEWTKKRNLSLWGTLFIIFCGSSFFFFDGFSLSHISLWGQWTQPFVYPLLHCMEGITWINIPLSVAFLFLIKSIHFDRSDYRLVSFLLVIAALAGFFLISELFGILMTGWIVLLILYNLWKNKISLKKFLLFIVLFAILLCGAFYFTGGALANLFFTKTSLQKVVSLRPISQWGYYSESELMHPWKFFVAYLENFFLVAILVFTLIYALAKRKISMEGQLINFVTIPIMFVVPFVFSISMGNLNLYKLVHLAIILTYLLFFCYFPVFWKWSKALVVAIMILFVFGSLPVIMVNYGVQWGRWAGAETMHCAYNDLCYDSSEAEFLKNFETENKGLKHFFTAPQDQQAIVDLTNSYAVAMSAFPENNSFSGSQIYVFYSPNLNNLLTPSELERFKNLQVVAEKGDYQILKY